MSPKDPWNVCEKALNIIRARPTLAIEFATFYWLKIIFHEEKD